MIKTRILGFVLFLLLNIFCAIAQDEKEDIYFLFDSKSKDTCKGWSGWSYTHVKKYTKQFRKKGLIIFSICNEYFDSYKHSSRDTLNISFLKTVHLTHEDEILRRIGKAFYHHNVFGKLYFLEKINDNVLVKYDVEWQNEIE